MRAGRVGVSIELTSNHLTYIWNMKRHATKPVFDHEAANSAPELVYRKKLIGGKYATVATRKLAPGEKRMDPIGRLLKIRDEIVREEAEQRRAVDKKKPDTSRQEAA